MQSYESGPASGCVIAVFFGIIATVVGAHGDEFVLEAFPLPAGSRPHDVAPALDGGVWYTAQNAGDLGWLDPNSGQTRQIPLGPGSRPHGVIVGPDGAPWITDGGLNAIVRVDPFTDEVTSFPLPPNQPNANLNTATFDHNGVLWFTGQNGIYGRLDPANGKMDVFAAPRGRGPYGISTTPDGHVYYASLAGSYVGRIDVDTGEATVLNPPTSGQGARRVWPDSQGRIWVSEWNAGQLALYEPEGEEWREWRLPGANPRAYSVYVDDQDIVWLSDFGANAIVRFDPTSEQFDSIPLPSDPSNVRQILGRPGEVWGAESAADQLVVIRLVSELSCDFNSDGLCDVSDIDLMSGVGDLSTGVSVPPADPVFDLDTNDVIDISDVDQWLAAAASQNGFSAPYTSGDSDLNGVVDAADLNVLALNWQQDVALWSGGDFTADGSVNSADLNELGINWQQSIPLAAAQNVPEPTSVILLVFGLAGIVRGRR
jgi:virginiamycin B lyase